MSARHDFNYFIGLSVMPDLCKNSRLARDELCREHTTQVPHVSCRLLDEADAIFDENPQVPEPSLNRTSPSE